MMTPYLHITIQIYPLEIKLY